MEEKWVDIQIDRYGLLRISNTGKIYSYKAKKELCQCYTTDGYKRVKIKLSNPCQAKELKVHRLVALVFVPNPENKTEVNHIDGIRDNNDSNNLEWVTHAENILHAYKIGNKTNVGIKNPNAKLTIDDVKRIRKLYKEGMSAYAIAKIYNRGWQTINHIIKRTTWKEID